MASPIYKKALRALSSAFERLHFKSLVLVSAPESAPVSALESPRKRSESAPYELTKALSRALRGLKRTLHERSRKRSFKCTHEKALP